MRLSSTICLLTTSLDVAALAWHVFAPGKSLNIEISALLGIQPKELQQLFTAIVALHDLGKKCNKKGSDVFDAGITFAPWHTQRAKPSKNKINTTPLY